MGTLLITAAFLSCGAAASERYRSRVFALQSSLEALEALILRLRATLAPPMELLSGFCGEYNEPPDYFVFALESAEDIGFEKAWENALRLSTLALDENDRSLITRFGEMIGKSDIQTQLSRMRLLTEQLKARISAARAESEQKCHLCQTLYALAGAAFVVLLL